MLFGLALGKEKNVNLVDLSSEQDIVFGRIYSIIWTTNVLYYCIVDCDGRESRLSWLGRVLLCLVEVGLK